MKVWFDISPHADQKKRDCNDCVNPSAQPVFIPWPETVDGIASVRHITLEHTTPLHIQQCAEARWLVCNPTRPGRMAVFDVQALALLSLFIAPMTISQAVQLMTDWPPEAIEKMATLFYQLGFLQAVHGPVRSDVNDSSETLVAWLHVTNDCNLRCSYCYISKSREKMPLPVGYQAVDAIFRSALKHGFSSILLKYAGGEASLHLMNVLALHDYASELACRYEIRLEATILSNGVTLSPQAIDRLKERQIDVTISLDGLGAYHDSQRLMLNGQGSSRYVLRTIERLLASEVVPFLAITVSNRSLAGLPALMEYILERGLPFSLNYYRDNECSANIADLRFADAQIIAAMHAVFAVIEKNIPEKSLLDCLLDKANITDRHQYTCGVGRNYLVIDQRGGVAKCQMEITNTVTTVDVEDPLQLVRDDRRGIQGLAVEEKEGCRACEWRYWCTGGCPVTTYRVTGRYDVKSPNCNIYKTLFPAVLRLEALRLLRHTRPFTLACAPSQR